MEIMPAMLPLFCLSLLAGALALPLYKDPSQPVESRVADLLGRMTLSEKIAQMTQIERVNASQEVIRRYGIGSVLNGGGSWPAANAAPNQWVDMIDSYQIGASHTRLGIPVIYGIDAVHGHNNVYGATIFPHNIGLGATRDPELVKRIGAATASEVKATGIPYAFAPCVAVCRDPRWGRCYESYGEDTNLVRNMTSLIDGLQGTAPSDHQSGVPYVAKGKIAACAKHYVGDGGTTRGIDENNTLASYDDLMRIHMPPYYDALNKGVCTIMISYSSWNGVKMHANRQLITDFLKGRLGFKGFTISDWQGIDRITNPPDSNYSYSVQASINAGIDMIMVPFDYKRFMNTLTDLFQRGIVSMDRINDAVTRILRVKLTLGLFENPRPQYNLTYLVGRQEHREIAREAVRKSLVLLKNGKDGPLLPLSKNANKILVAGSHANDIGLQCGGWTITWQGGKGPITAGTTILEGINKAVGSNKVVYNSNPDSSFVKSHNFAYGIVVVGENPYAEFDGDNTVLTLSEESIQTIENVCGSLKCLVILISGRPLVLQPHLSLIDAFVAAWLPGSQGEGIADVIFGDYDFVGKLPRTWFKSVNQLPMNVGDHNYDPLFPYGFGLSMRQ